MALEYTSKIGLDAIMPVLDEYVVWYGKLMRSYFEGKALDDLPPSVFDEWVENTDLPESIAERARKIHEGMVQAARNFSVKCASHTEGAAPPAVEYNELSRNYEEFIHFMHRLEIDLANENNGFDVRTGLRPAKLMYEDIAREMERRARQGNPFALAIAKINNFQEDWRARPEEIQAMVRDISDRIRQSLRSFDDAYYLGDEYFVLSFKQADMVGAQAALNRLNHALKSSPVPYHGNPQEVVSLTSVFCEPSPGDSLDVLIDNLKRDMGGVEEDGIVLQYNDLSPIQRYMHSIEEDK